jgi:hypothetical protein
MCRWNVDEKKSWPRLLALASFFSVELPGIEPGPEIALNWDNSEKDDAK